jgi:hypothetical protein
MIRAVVALPARVGAAIRRARSDVIDAAVGFPGLMVAWFVAGFRKSRSVAIDVGRFVKRGFKRRCCLPIAQALSWCIGPSNKTERLIGRRFFRWVVGNGLLFLVLLLMPASVYTLSVAIVSASNRSSVRDSHSAGGNQRGNGGVGWAFAAPRADTEQ